MRILILGGYGVFGGRLAQLLSDLDGIELLICGRRLSRAQAFCEAYRGHPHVQALALDRRHIAEGLLAHRPHVVVDASGPFQDYGEDRYRVIESCIAAGIDYLDFADGADFVFGVSHFDARARAAGVVVLSGASSFPVLTAAVLRAMALTMDIVAVEGGIAPSPHAGIGLNVMRAVLGYAGGPVKLLRGGRPATATGLAESRRFTVAVPGCQPLHNLRFSLVDVPDLRVLPPEHPVMTDIWMGAGSVPESLHRLLNLLAATRAQFRLPALTPFAPLFHAVLNRLRFGAHRGGMLVRVHGRSEGRAVVRSWHLLAEGDDGPRIPSMAIEALIRKRLRGERLSPGARSAVHALEIADYDVLFRGRTIVTGFRDEKSDGPLFRRVLGSAFDELPPRVRELHDGTELRRWTGSAEVRQGAGLLARMIAAGLGFPRAAASVPVSVSFRNEGGCERWTRNFGGQTFTSIRSAGSGRDEYLLVERFGILRVALALVCDAERLVLVPRRWTLLGIPIPTGLLSTGRSFETDIAGRFCFDITVAMPVVGLIVAYRGTLEPDPCLGSPVSP